MTVARLLLAVWMLAVATSAGAQPLQDPTRPPTQLMHPSEASAPSADPQLQSVLIARQPGGRHVAVIDGETVQLGGSFRGARVVRMTPDQVELQRGTSRQVLKLHPPQAGTAPAAPGKTE